ncbi:unnamed protein product, partial [marine sediment metagenome]
MTENEIPKVELDVLTDFDLSFQLVNDFNIFRYKPHAAYILENGHITGITIDNKGLKRIPKSLC